MSRDILSNDLIQIESELKVLKRQAGCSLFEIGRRLNHVRDQGLAGNNFRSWVESQGMTVRSAYKMMSVADRLDDRWENETDLGLEALYLISRLPEEEREAEQETEAGEAKVPRDMTVAELRRLNKEKNPDARTPPKAPPNPEETATESQSPPETGDRATIARLEAELEEMKERESFLMEEYEEVRAEKNEMERKNLRRDDLDREVDQLTCRRDAMEREVSGYRNLTQIREKVDELLTLISPTALQDNFSQIQENPTLKQHYLDILNRVEDWCEDMHRLLMDKSNIIEMKEKSK